MRKETEKQLNQILGALIVPEGTKDKLINLVEGLEAEIEAGLHSIHYLEKKSNAAQNEYDMLRDSYQELADRFDDFVEEVA